MTKETVWHHCSSSVVSAMFSGEESSQACVRREADPGARDRNVQEHRHCAGNGNTLRRPLHFCGQASVCSTCGE